MLLEISGITKSFPGNAGPHAVLDGVSLMLDAGETLALTGESGSGKSTLLTLVAGLDQPDSGEITLDGMRVDTLTDACRARLRRDRVGLVFQQFNLIPSLNVTDNISFQARLAGRHDAAFAAHLAHRLGLEGLGARFPDTLSGGQQQRVAIGRALASRPALVLADEPTGNLDEATSDDVLDLMLDLVADAGAALLMVTHSTRMADRLGTRRHLSGGRLG